MSFLVLTGAIAWESVSYLVLTGAITWESVSGVVHTGAIYAHSQTLISLSVDLIKALTGKTGLDTKPTGVVTPWLQAVDACMWNNIQWHIIIMNFGFSNIEKFNSSAYVCVKC